jgi:hypothetical protein
MDRRSVADPPSIPAVRSSRPSPPGFAARLSVAGACLLQGGPQTHLVR